MRLFTPTVVCFALLHTVCASNSGIFDDNGELSPQVYIATRQVKAERSDYSHLNNAERLRRGLPLRPPTARRENARRAVASPQACVPLASSTGVIGVSSGAGGPVGYISNSFDDQNSYTFTPTLANALRVQLPSLSPYNTPIEITAINGPDSAHPFVGAVSGSNGNDFLADGRLGYAYLAGTGHTPANSPPSSAGTSLQELGYNGYSESTIWTLSCNLGITGQWTNWDGSQPNSQLFYNPKVDYLGLTCDTSAINAAYDEGAIYVTFTFIPLT